jgi:putative phosphoesterase
MRVEALAALAGVELILHAGDVGPGSVLQELERLAPVRAVAGNVDDPATGLPPQVRLSIDGLSIVVTHGHELGSPTPQALAQRYEADVIIYGHTHRPLTQTVRRTLVINPGAAGPRRFNLEPSVALLTIEKRSPSVKLIKLTST